MATMINDPCEKSITRNPDNTYDASVTLTCTRS